jgi:hypothetical protein
VSEASRIQDETKEFRAEVEGWSETKLRQEGEDRGIPGYETAPQVTLAEAIVQHERDQLRTDAHGAAELPETPGLRSVGTNRLSR